MRDVMDKFKFIEEFAESLATIEVENSNRSRAWLDGRDAGLKMALHLAEVIARELLDLPQTDKRLKKLGMTQ